MLRPTIGVSACLLGQAVRYNGGHTRHPWLVESLAPHVELVPVCPEVAMGLPIPREPMRLQRTENGVRLQTTRSGDDQTALAEATVATMIDALPPDLDAFVLMSFSPLCGATKVKLYDRNGSPAPLGIGFFAAALQAARPNLLVVDSGRLLDTAQAEHFALRLFTQARFRRLDRRVAALQAFHRDHKFLLMAHDERAMRALGRIAASARPDLLDRSLATYGSILRPMLAVPPTRPRMADALTHMYGFLKRDLADNERHELLARINDYARGAIPLAVPLALLHFANTRIGNAYLGAQTLFAPAPLLGAL